MRINLSEAKELYDDAELYWEFYDASPQFQRFASWLEDNFADLLRLAWDNANRED